MPRADRANVRNAPGPWYVDTRRVKCDAARHWAPGLIEMDDAGRSLVARHIGRNRELRLEVFPVGLTACSPRAIPGG